MTPDQLQSLKHYVDFGEAEAQALRRFARAAEPHFDAIVDDFYGAIAAHPRAAAAISGGPQQVDRLKHTLKKWMWEVLHGPHDEAYLQARSRIGRVHVKIALPQEFMFSAMNRVRVRLLDVVGANDGLVARAINQILDIELAIMLDSYREDSIEQMRGAERLAIIESVPAFVLALDEHGRIVFWNRRLEEATGHTREAVTGQLGTDVVGAMRGEHKLATQSRARIVRWQRADVVDTERHRTTLVIGVDVTEEREMQRRTVRSERLAAVGTMAAGLAHEVRNPLNSASLQLQVLERRIAKGDTRSEALTPVVKLVHDEIRRLARLVSDFLAFARPAPLELRSTSIGPLVESVIELVGPECAAAGIDLRTELEGDLGAIQADSERLRQVMLNIVRNSAEAIVEDGSILIRVRSDHADGTVRIDVVDDGPGFADEAPIFDAFFTTKEQGTGLGLALVHSIVSEHGGTVSVRSQPGATCFTVTLPLAPSRPPSP